MANVAEVYREGQVEMRRTGEQGSGQLGLHAPWCQVWGGDDPVLTLGTAMETDSTG